MPEGDWKLETDANSAVDARYVLETHVLPGRAHRCKASLVTRKSNFFHAAEVKNIPEGDWRLETDANSAVDARYVLETHDLPGRAHRCKASLVTRKSNFFHAECENSFVIGVEAKLNVLSLNERAICLQRILKSPSIEASDNLRAITRGREVKDIPEGDWRLETDANSAVDARCRFEGKLIPKGVSRKDTEISQVYREISALHGLGDLSCVPTILFEGYIKEGFLVLLTDFARQPLESWISEIILDLLLCLEKIHARGYTHGDVAIRNVIHRNGHFYLIDFGLATLLQLHSDPCQAIIQDYCELCQIIGIIKFGEKMSISELIGKFEGELKSLVAFVEDASIRWKITDEGKWLEKFGAKVKQFYERSSEGQI
ncbi:kinase-like domain-containing protein [Rhizophagus irregularis DAOM 181602=DAOM 197198]|nr:kinase-like domain-containing protein [Rhizophagus irregularis DAOM 181602=DAOM 197198]